MSRDLALANLRAGWFHLHAKALDRHLIWAMEYAEVGEDEAADDALRDARALLGELSDDDA